MLSCTAAEQDVVRQIAKEGKKYSGREKIPLLCPRRAFPFHQEDGGVNEEITVDPDVWNICLFLSALTSPLALPSMSRPSS